MRRITSLVAALALTLSMAAPSLANTGTTPETLSVTVTTSLTVPASISFGTGAATVAQRSATPASPVVNFTSDNPKGVTLSVVIANLSNGNGGSIPATAHRWTGTATGATANVYYGTQASYATAQQTLASSTASVANGSYTMGTLTLNTLNAAPGNYTGSMAFTLVENP